MSHETRRIVKEDMITQSTAENATQLLRDVANRVFHEDKLAAHVARGDLAEVKRIDALLGSFRVFATTVEEMLTERAQVLQVVGDAALDVALCISMWLRADLVESHEWASRLVEEVSAAPAWQRDHDAAAWARAQKALGFVYFARKHGDRAQNAERSIACFEALLEVDTREADPHNWAMTQNNLGNVYAVRIRGDRAENRERAITCFEAALEVYTRETDRGKWASLQSKLGTAYGARNRGDFAENCERAIACYEAAIEVYTRDADPMKWVAMHFNLGVEYVCRIRGDRAENQRRAIACIVAAVEVDALFKSSQGAMPR
jgi:tetratricopeptide (TPR) repeat protein